MRYNILTYHIGEGIRNLFKNKKSTIASLCIMTATMLMFGIFFIIGQNINHIMKIIEEDQGIKAFIIDGADFKEVQEVRDIISQIDGVASATICTKQDALDEMKMKFKDNEDLLEGYEGDNNIFPDSVMVKLSDLEKNASVQEKIKQITINGENYIDSIQSSDKTINALNTIDYSIEIASFNLPTNNKDEIGLFNAKNKDDKEYLCVYNNYILYALGDYLYCIEIQ